MEIGRKLKNINEICVIIQARLNSDRLPGKMTKNFSDTNLLDIANLSQ